MAGISVDLEKALEECRRANARVRRQIALLKAIIRVFRETLPCETEENVARICLKIAEDLTGSAYGFMGELNAEGFFDTRAVSDSGWNACEIPGEEAETPRSSTVRPGFGQTHGSAPTKSICLLVPP